MMSANNFYEYLLSLKPGYRKELEYIKFELDRRFYHYGEYFSSPFFVNNDIEGIIIKKRSNILRDVKDLIKKIIVNKEQVEIFDDVNKVENNNVIVYQGYSLNANIKNELEINGYILEDPIYIIHPLLKKISRDLQIANLATLISDSFLKELKKAYEIMYEYYNSDKYSILIVPFDMPPMERIIIDVFRKLNKKSIVYLHGLPAHYNVIDNLRCDFLLVWGEKIKENYINLGVNPEKIRILPNNKYSSFKLQKLRFSFDKITVLTFALSGAQPGNELIQYDRSVCIRYLMEIQTILESLGIEKVKLRPHPSENPEWYREYIDVNFYSIDSLSLEESLRESTLVIGPSSTCLLDALYAGVNYCCYEPIIDGKRYDTLNTYDPFDGTNEKIPVAKSPGELEIILKNRECIEPSVFWEYNDKNVFDITELIT